jgi:hypothetical protein
MTASLYQRKEGLTCAGVKVGPRGIRTVVRGALLRWTVAGIPVGFVDKEKNVVTR